MKLLLYVLLGLQLTLCFGQSNENNPIEGDLMDYMKIVFEQCSNPDIIEVESTQEGYIEVEYVCDGKQYEIGIKQNTLLFREHTLNLNEIPLENIKRKIAKEYQGWTLDEVSQIKTNDTTFLKVEILKEGIEQNLYFTNDGMWFKIKPIDITTTINMSALEKNASYKSASYNFHKPDSVYELPDLLNEISGLALSSANVIYCIQDEIGAIFEYDLTKQNISNVYRFTDIGDFEDIVINKNIAYVLRSDGNLFEYDLKSKSQTSQTMLQVSSLNIEGICLSDGYIFIACKDALINHDESKRIVYKAKANNLDEIETYLEINLDELIIFLKDNYPEIGISEILFNPSSIAIHPITKEMYILSAEDRFIAIYKESKLINIIPLSSEIYYKPEGLSFYENGNLLISSEGDKKGFVKGTINSLTVQ